ncbi:hypothetical protein [Thorsellia anophelis]|uniref:Uncharacterized protein n=1 Tax=Thorsellia anophelis DSM 18579 TaxID=1123402 RepID=A0A1I0FIP1_9GAMM|nr:hypothetical protein [Thorsellia anophelis]SET57867.1 hypothetical protein SAMN02583745_02775 [Thorsellia anophelis DSM 18579]
MQPKNKIKCLVVAMAVLSTSSFAATIIEKKAGTTVMGHFPYFESIGSRVIESSINDNGTLKISVGAKIEVPSYLYQYNSNTKSPLFNFGDQDNDVAAILGNPNPGQIPPALVPDKFTEVQWYIIEAMPGFRFADEPGTEKVIERWNDEQVKIIRKIEDEQFVNFFEGNQNSKALIVPEAAVGYRIGFWALPQTETGVPNAGNWVKVFDLGRLFTQKAPEEPGPGENPGLNPDNPNNPDPDPGCNNEKCGEPGGENPDGGGGIVPGENWVINIYDAMDPTKNDDDVLVKDTDILKVDHQYYATIRIRKATPTEGIGTVYRDPTPEELETLEWEILDTKDGNKPFASYKSSTNPTRVNNDAGSVTIGSETFKKYSFTTQATNDDALQVLKDKGPNFSEQGWGLGIKLEIQENYTEKP